MAKVLIIIAQEGFQDHEFGVPKQILENAGHEVTVSSLTTKPATGAFSVKVTPDIAIKDAKSDDYDMISIVGGPGALKLLEHEEVMKLIKDMNEKSKKVCAICISPVILANAGVLKGKKATVFPTEQSIAALKNNGAEYTKEDVIVDGNIITANGPQSAEKYGEKLVEALS